MGNLFQKTEPQYVVEAAPFQYYQQRYGEVGPVLLDNRRSSLTIKNVAKRKGEGALNFFNAYRGGELDISAQGKRVPQSMNLNPSIWFTYPETPQY